MQSVPEPSEESLKEAREFAIKFWSESYIKLRVANDLEAMIMDDAHDLAAFAAKSDTRTATILLVSFLEDALEKTFVDQWGLGTRKQMERYFGSSGPLSTFSQRALVARGMHWLTSAQVAELDILRRIRNTFAHNHRIHALSDAKLEGLVMSLPNREEIWCREEGAYKNAHDAADVETRYRLRVFCAGIFNISSILVNAKTQRAQIPLGFRPASGWDGMLEVEQAMIDAAIRFCWTALGLGYSGAVYEYRRNRTAMASAYPSEKTQP